MKNYLQDKFMQACFMWGIILGSFLYAPAFGFKIIIEIIKEGYKVSGEVGRKCGEMTRQKQTFTSNDVANWAIEASLKEI